MYASFFGLRENPFNLTPDPRYLFLSPYHRDALNHLLYGINERKGFIVITGGIGTGKTTLCRALLTHLNSSTKSALIFNPFISDIELLKAINHEFGIDLHAVKETKKDYIDALNQFLLEIFSRGGNAVLLIDEAQNLDQSVLEQIRMLSNLETEKEKLLQIVLVGQSELRELIRSASLKQLDERIMVRYNLNPLDHKDMVGYMEHRLVIAGGRGDLRFTGGAIKKLFKYSLGNPRRINTVCDRALLIAYTIEKYKVSRKIIEEAIKDLRGDIRVDQQNAGWSFKRLVSSALLLLVLIMAAAFGGWSLRKDIFELIWDQQKTAVVSAKIIPPKALKLKKRSISLFLDDQMSLSHLFTKFNSELIENNIDIEDVHLSVVSIDVDPEYYIMFKKSFRILLPDSVSTNPTLSRFLLILKIGSNVAIVLDKEGNEREITRDTLLNHGRQKISWIYPDPKNGVNLTKGMEGEDVLKLQRLLNEIGYLVKLTEIYDDGTVREVIRFQKDFGLMADGIAGHRTMALLYQMMD